MKVALEHNKAIIDDKLEVTPDGAGYKFAYPGMFGNFITIAQPLGSEVDTSSLSSFHKKQDGVKYDPYYYLNGHNGLTVDESTARAFDRVYNEQLTPNLSIDRSSPELIEDSIRTIIERGKGRHEVYRLAGTLINRYKSGYYKGVPFHVIFKAVVDGHIAIGFYS